MIIPIMLLIFQSAASLPREKSENTVYTPMNTSNKTFIKYSDCSMEEQVVSLPAANLQLRQRW